MTRTAHPSPSAARPGRPGRRAALLAVPLVALVLTGCTTGPDEPAPTASTASDDCEAPDSGALSDGVDVTGDVESKPQVAFDSPLEVTSTQRTTLVEGDGEVAEQGSVANVRIAVYDAATGAEVTSAGFDDGQQPTQLTVSTDYYVPGIVDAIACVASGSRTVTVASAADMTTATATEQDAAPTPVVIVADVVSIVPTKATGEAQAPTEGFPTVELADDGQPTVTIPDGTDPPSDLRIEVLKKGDGAVVPDPANVTVQYQGVNWTTGEVFDQSWGKGTPTPFSTDQVVPGFAKAMIGQTVGSQVVVIIPPSEGYGDAGQPSAGIGGTDTLVFVIDILAVA
ncbi:FKBP-type peptidyl-prolyl cis-trans isomerase [Frigoribacterium sp. Leaf186]|uniref:FKBP-type peptidyl-prolyl cis-trans isomerase n=1 Tax=Frigoribacterium sp. Leaf186 TaxID=1736293 RepID=UPI0009EB75FD|nr:FKBP-type peptidyl-prolyl cis-trans isomerase [Frigoribacterium sp. Leaf186]